MANSYVESSFAIALENDAELAWWKAERVKILALMAQGRAVAEEDPRLDWEIESLGKSYSVWFHHDESIDVDVAADVIQRFLKECGIKRGVGFTWAETCSKPRLDSFGGGACFVTADEISWLGAHVWLQAATAKHEAKP